MKFDTPASTNPIDQLKVVGKATDRIDGSLKTTGTAPYAYERHDVAPNQAYGFILGAAIAKGRINRMDLRDAKAASGVLAIVSTLDMPKLPLGQHNAACLFGGAEIAHYHQAIALVVAETFEQARAATSLIRVDYSRTEGKFDLAGEAMNAPYAAGNNGAPPIDRVGELSRPDGAQEVRPALAVLDQDRGVLAQRARVTGRRAAVEQPGPGQPEPPPRRSGGRDEGREPVGHVVPPSCLGVANLVTVVTDQAGPVRGGALRKRGATEW